MSKAIALAAPAGMSGLAVAPWASDEIYAVAADWSQAAAPVYTYGDHQGGWQPNGRQVADYRHNTRRALRVIVERAIVMSGGEIDEDEECLEVILDKAVEIDAE